jgi:hypothetical protein
VIALIKALPDNSRFHAAIAGGPEYVGWGKDRHLLADIYDAIILNTRATGNWTEPPDIPSYPRPTSKKPDEKPKQTVKGLWAMLNRGGTKKQ